MRNKMSDLNNHLFAQLERLADEALTRRVLKPQPQQNDAGLWIFPPDWTAAGFKRWGFACQSDEASLLSHFTDDRARSALPYVVGDRLYVREAHYLTDTGDYEIAVYAEDAGAVQEHFDLINSIAAKHCPSDAWKAPHLKLRPSIHMPRWASRLTLTVNEVAVQRLQGISEADALAEGVGKVTTTHPKLGRSVTAVEGYQALWNSLHGPAAWEVDPWVVAVSFTVHHGNIDEVSQ